MYLHDNQVYNRKELGMFAADVPLTPKLVDGKPRAYWKGEKMPFSEWQKMCAWFTATNARAKSETQVRLFFNAATGGWRLGPLPQKFPTGLTTTELPDNPAYTAIKESLMAGGYEQVGTVHHHCDASAFQSGTDTADERNSPGVHITVGNLSSQNYTLHARVVVVLPGELNEKGEVVSRAATLQYEAAVSDFVAPPTPIPSWVPPTVAAEAVTAALTRSCAGAEYPAAWDDALIAVPERTPSWNDYGAYGSWSHTSPKNRQRTATWDEGDHIASDSGASFVESVLLVGGKRYPESDVFNIIEECEDTARWLKVPFAALIEHADKMLKGKQPDTPAGRQLTHELSVVARDYKLSISDIVEILKWSAEEPGEAEAKGDDIEIGGVMYYREFVEGFMWEVKAIASEKQLSLAEVADIYLMAPEIAEAIDPDVQEIVSVEMEELAIRNDLTTSEVVGIVRWAAAEEAKEVEEAEERAPF